MISIFTNILTVSFQATIVGIIIVLFKRMFKSRINVRISYLLWILVLIRLVFPVLPLSPFSIFNVNLDGRVSQLTDYITYNQNNNSNINIPAYDNEKIPDSINNFADSSTSTTVINNNTIAGTPSSNANNFEHIILLSYIWAIIMTLIIAYIIFVNMLFAFRLKKMTQIVPPEGIISKLKYDAKLQNCTIKFVEGDNIQSPCVFGIFKYTILLPKDFLYFTNEKALYRILMHEFAHIKHFDLLINWLTSLLCAVHWFNPMIWYFSKLIKRDQELCADAYTMSNMEDDEILDYGQTLLSIIKQHKKHPLAIITAGITEDKKSLKQRFIKIAAFSKNKYRISFISILFMAIAGIFLCTSQMDYPKTGAEKMKFDDNITMNFNFNNSNNPNSFELVIKNNNKISLHSCEIEIYSANPNKPDSVLLFSNKNFKISGNNSKRLDLLNIDYNTAHIKFSYKTGFSFSNSNQAHRGGDLRAFDSTLKPDEWSAATNEEVNVFIEENHINVIAINQIYNFYTIVLFESSDASGYYEIYKVNKSNEIRSRRIISFSSQSKYPVQLLGGTASGDYPFINFKINSPILLALGHKIELQSVNGPINSYVSGTSSHTVPTRGYGNINKILIYDKNEKLIYDGDKILLKDVDFKPDDTTRINIMEEKGYKIVNQYPVSHQINFTKGMFSENYVKAHESNDIDWKLPLFTYENTTMYLKSIVESNESPDFLVASIYFIHNVEKSPGNILSSVKVNFSNVSKNTYSTAAIVNKDAFSETFNSLKDTVSFRSSGPGDQIGIYLNKSMVDKTNGEFTISLEGLNQISYVPASQHIAFDYTKKNQMRDMVYNKIKNSNEKFTGKEEIYATVGLKGQEVFSEEYNKPVDVSGRYVYYVSFHTELDGLLGPVTYLVDPKTEKIIGQFLRF